MNEKKSLFAEAAEELSQYVIHLRRDFHRHPEVGYQEIRTSARICEELEKNGIPFEKIGHNMVIATIEGGRPGKTLGIRADMDALPMEEKTDVPYRSQNEGVMHSCGHDAHVAMLLGAGVLLNSRKDQLAGSIKLIFQEAEELAGGSPEILEYLKKNGGLSRLISTHVWADLPAGHISVEPGGRMGGGIFFEITTLGKGGHGSRPDKIQDPLKAICQILLAITAIPSNRMSMLEPCIVSPGLIEGGTAFNIIPDTARIGGSLRFFSYEAGDRLMELVTQIAENTAKAYGIEAKVVFSGHVSPVVNDEAAAALAKEVVEKIDGLVSDAYEPICACDCFGDLLREYPGMYCYLGVGNASKGIVFPQHHCQFDVDEDALIKGVEFACQYAYDYLMA